jgi:predicted dinucleotide-binding enzyme
VRRDLPSGTVTFLFTDIEGSTRLLHELGAEAYAQALAEHRRVLREAFARHGGVEVDTQGDALFVVFPTAPGALEAAQEAQEALARGQISVRMGLHTGTPHLTEEGYVGPPVHGADLAAASLQSSQCHITSEVSAGPRAGRPGSGRSLTSRASRTAHGPGWLATEGRGRCGSACSEREGSDRRWPRKMASRGHEVMVGTRDVQAALARTEAGYGAKVLSEWHAEHPDVKLGTFAEAAAHAEIVINATAGMASLDALLMAGAENLEGKILVDVANPLDFSSGMPPTLSVCNTDSLGEQIQRAFPGAKVVKTLNTVNMNVMVDPGLIAGGDHTMFVSGDDESAKAEVTGILKEWFGWKNVLDLGDVTSARAVEMFLPLWLRLSMTLQTSFVTIKVVT